MISSKEINEVASALVAAQAEFGAVPKGSVNPFFKSKYAALPDVVAHAAPVLAKHGLSITQSISFVVGMAQGQAPIDTLTTTLLHQSGQYIESEMLLHLPKQDPQGQGSAVTYARRYSYMAILGLVADDDDDGNAASRSVVRKPMTQGNDEKTVERLTENGSAVRDLTTQLREKLALKYGEPIKGKQAVEEILGKQINKLSELTDAEVAGVILSLDK
jgi:hypothetical protein